MSLESIDTSFWLTKDKAWVEARKADWPRIEKMFCHRKTKRALTVIKQYYLKGKMPKWEDFKYWDDYYRHLDLFSFLWLHPSSDLSVLESLYQTYMLSDLIHHEDALRGYSEFLDSHFILVGSPYESMDDYGFPFSGSKALTLFRVLYKDANFIKEQLTRHLRSSDRFEREGKLVVYGSGFSYLCIMSEWLMIEKVLPLHCECLYQYDEVLDWCYLSFSQDKNYFEENNDKEVLDQYHTALYRIHHFDTKKEGDTCRTRFAHKIRKILDEREFIPEFKQMWEDVKADKIEVQDPWKH